MSVFYDFTVPGLGRQSAIFWRRLRGKVTLAVNVASRCGYTPQYAGLEDLYQELKDQEFHGGRFSLQSVRRAGAGHGGGNSNVL